MMEDAIRSCCAAMASLLAATAAVAQPASGVGGALPQGSPIPRVLPSPTPQVAPSLPLGPVQGGVPATGNVGIRSVTLEGATAYADPVLREKLAGLTGPAVPLARIEAARLAILNLYRADRFALTTVTATLDSQGVLRFAVVEGRIADVKLDGDIGPAGTQVLRFLNHLTEVRPIDTRTLERWLLLAQDVPGITLRAVLQPSAAEPGALTLVAQVDRKAVGGLLTIDNRAFRLTGTEQGLAVLDFNSFTQFGERSQVTLYHTSGNTQDFGQGSSEFFVGGSGLRVKAYGGYGEANPAGFLRDIGYHGTTTVFGVSATYPLIRSRQATLNLNATFDGVETQIRTNTGPGGSSIRSGRDSLRVLRLGGDYALEDGLLGDERPAVNTLTVKLSQGLPAFGANSNGGADGSRIGAKFDFTKVAIDASRTQTLFQPWESASVALRGRVLGQLSGDVLPPAEKFFLGGPDYTRGFYSGEVTGDNALVLSAELQLNTSYDVPLFGRSFPIAVQYYGFFDYGQTWERQKLDANARLSSIGLGFRLNVTRFTEFDLEGVHRNTRLVRSGSAAVSPLKADALYWRVVTRF